MTKTITERRQELIERLARKYNWTDCNIPKDQLNEVYGLNLRLQEFKSGSAEEMGWVMRASYNPDSFNPIATQVIRNMLELRKLSDRENRYKTLPDPVETACENLRYDIWHGGGLMAMAYYAIDPFSDKVRNRTLTKEEFEKQISGNITGANDEAQRKLLELYAEFKRNGQHYKEGEHYPISFPPISWERKNREISEAEWEEYKRKHLNPNHIKEKPEVRNPSVQKKCLTERILSYLGR